jgi:hypothetical protein
LFHKTKALRASLIAATALLALPATGLAATSASTDAAATVGSELSVAATPTTTFAPALTHTASAIGTTDVDVTSTNQNWSLTATDAAAIDRGHMKGTSTTLGDPLAVSAPDTTLGAAKSGDLTAVEGLSVTGQLVERKAFTFTQSLLAAEDVVAGAAYGLTVTFTVSVA